MLIVMIRFSKTEYCEMLYLCSECGRKARSATNFYRQRFSAGAHPSQQPILTDVKRLRQTVFVTSRARCGSPTKVGQQVRRDEVLAYAVAYLKCSTREISVHYGLENPSELGAHPYRPIP